MKLLKAYFVIATLFSVLVNSSPIEKRDTTISILTATTVPASASCTNISTNLPKGFSATTRIITPQWVEDNGYSLTPDPFSLFGDTPDSRVAFYQYSGYLYAEQEGEYSLDFTFLSNPANSYFDVYYGDDAGMDCCGDLSDYSVNWPGVLKYTPTSYSTVTASSAGIFIPVRYFFSSN